MPVLEAVESAKSAGFVTNSSQREKRQKRLEAEQAELEAFLKGKTEDVENEESNEEDVGSETENQKEENSQEKDKSLSPEESTFKKRYGDLRRHSQQKEKEWLEKIEQLEARVKASGSIAPPKSDEDILEWSKKYPDIAGIVERIADKKAEERFNSADERLKKLDEQQDLMNREKAENVIRQSHPDFDKLRDEDSFYNWVDEQSKWIQDAVYENENDPKAVIRVIDLYKLDTGQTAADKKKQAKDAAKSIKTNSNTTVETDLVDSDKPKFSESQVLKNSDAWFAKNYEAILEAQREGRFDYDVSKKK